MRAGDSTGRLKLMSVLWFLEEPIAVAGVLSATHPTGQRFTQIIFIKY